MTSGAPTFRSLSMLSMPLYLGTSRFPWFDAKVFQKEEYMAFGHGLWVLPFCPNAAAPKLWGSISGTKMAASKCLAPYNCIWKCERVAGVPSRNI